MDPESIAKVVKATGGKRPVSMTVTKTFDTSPKANTSTSTCSAPRSSCKVYMPSINLLSAAGLDIRRLEMSRAKELEEVQVITDFFIFTSEYLLSHLVRNTYPIPSVVCYTSTSSLFRNTLGLLIHAIIEWHSKKVLPPCSLNFCQFLPSAKL